MEAHRPTVHGPPPPPTKISGFGLTAMRMKRRITRPHKETDLTLAMIVGYPGNVYRQDAMFNLTWINPTYSVLQ